MHLCICAFVHLFCALTNWHIWKLKFTNYLNNVSCRLADNSFMNLEKRIMIQQIVLCIGIKSNELRKPFRQKYLKTISFLTPRTVVYKLRKYKILVGCDQCFRRYCHLYMGAQLSRSREGIDHLVFQRNTVLFTIFIRNS